MLLALEALPGIYTITVQINLFLLIMSNYPHMCTVVSTAHTSASTWLVEQAMHSSNGLEALQACNLSPNCSYLLVQEADPLAGENICKMGVVLFLNS